MEAPHRRQTSLAARAIALHESEISRRAPTANAEDACRSEGARRRAAPPEAISDGHPLGIRVRPPRRSPPACPEKMSLKIAPERGLRQARFAKKKGTGGAAALVAPSLAGEPPSALPSLFMDSTSAVPTSLVVGQVEPPR